jgi:hypothetical protein
VKYPFVADTDGMVNFHASRRGSAWSLTDSYGTYAANDAVFNSGSSPVLVGLNILNSG